MTKSSAICLVFFVCQNFFRDINRSVLALFKGSSYIFADDTNADQLHTAQEQNQYDDGRKARYVDACNQLLQHHNDQIDNGRKRGEATKVGSQAQGSGRVTNDSIHSIVKQLAEVPFCFASNPLAGGVRDEASVVANPSEDALAESVVFRQIQNAVPDTATEGAEITGIGF